MVSKKRDDSSSSDIQVTPPSHPSSVLKSPEKLDSNHADSEETSSLLRSRKKRKATLASLAPASLVPDTKKYWSKDEELSILKGIVAYRNSTGLDYISNSAAFLRYIKDDIDGKVTRYQLVSKIRKLKQRFQDYLIKKRCSTNSHDSETFDLSMEIWGKDKTGSVNENMNKAKRTKSKVGEHEVVTNYELGIDDGSSAKVQTFLVLDDDLDDEPGNDDGSSAKSDSWDKLPSENVDKSMENEVGRKESEEIEAITNGEPKNDDVSTKYNSCDNKLPPENVEKRMENEAGLKESDEVDAVTKRSSMLPPENVEKLMENEEEDAIDDELCCLQDALEATMFQHLSNHAQKLMLQNLRNFKAKERKELSDEWKSLLVEEMVLKSKKQCFSAKLVKATLRD